MKWLVAPKTGWRWLLIHQRLLLATLALVSAVAVAAVVVPNSTRDTSAQRPRDPMLWPKFTMVYTLRDTDPVTGVPQADQTWRLVAESEYAWRSDLIRDGLAPGNVGSYQELKDGVLINFSAEKNYTARLPLTSINDVTRVTEELSPVALNDLRYQRGTGQGFSEIAAGATGRRAFTRRATAACVAVAALPPQAQGRGPAVCSGAAGAASVPVTIEERVVFDTQRGAPRFTGGIAIQSEKRVGGTVVHSFNADSLELN